MTADDRDPFALARAGEEDAQILALFREWLLTVRILNTRAEDDPDGCALATDLAERIADAPVQGAIGLAIKAFMFAYDMNEESNYAEEGNGADSCCIGPFHRDGENYSARLGRDDSWTDEAHLFVNRRSMRGLLASAARFVPDLEPLVAGIVSSPLSLPPEQETAAVPERRLMH